MTDASLFDKWLTTDVVAALTAHQLLEPVEGPNAVVFPPTFAVTRLSTSSPHDLQVGTDHASFFGGSPPDVSVSRGFSGGGT